MKKGIEKPKSWKEWRSGRKWYAYPLLPEWIAEWAHYGFNQVELLKVASVVVFVGGMGQYFLDAPMRLVQTEASFLALIQGTQLPGPTLEGSSRRNWLELLVAMGAGLSGISLEEWDLDNANLTRANLSGVDLTSADLFDADLTNVNLTGANLSSTHLTNANLTRANLSDASLSDADLSGTYLHAAAYLTIEQVLSARTWDMDDEENPTTFPSDIEEELTERQLRTRGG